MKVFIADAHVLTREGMKVVLSRKQGVQIVGEATDGRELSDKIGLFHPDVLVMDFCIPGSFSLEDVAFVRARFPQVGVLVISNNQRKQDILSVLDQGVHAYLLKECDEEEIFHAVDAAARGERFFCGKVMDVLLEEATHQCPPDALCRHCQGVSLTEREVEVVRLIAEGYTTREMAQKLFLSFHTITTHRKNIFRKLKVRSSSELVLYAIQQGILDVNAMR